MKSSDLEKALLWVIKIVLFAVPLLPLYISTSMLFPFITGKNFAFRIAVEIIFALWAGLAVSRPEFRPRLTPLFKAATIFIMVLFFADLLSPNPYRAFFSNYERMEGFMMLSHLYLYFVVLSGVFKTRKDWLIFFHVTLAVSVVVGFIGILQKLGLRVSLQGGFRVDSTIGNPTYLAAYLLFHIWLLVILVQQFWKKWWLETIYLATLIFELTILYFTATRGAVLALVAVSVLFLLSLAVFWRRAFPSSAGQRKWVVGFLVLAVVVPMLFWQFRGSRFIQQSPVLSRLTNYSLEEQTIQSRFKIWGMSARAVLDRPILGWGQENYYLVFQKYFHPGLYAQEPWFDRSHNVIFDWLVHAGVLGLASYLSILLAALWTLVKGIGSRRIPFWTGISVMALFLSHFLQNLFVFDNLNTYLLFFAFLAYTQYWDLAPAEVKKITAAKAATVRNTLSPAYAYATAAAIMLLVMFGGYFLHLKPIRASNALIQALRAHQSHKPLDEVRGFFEKTLSYNSFGDTEAREQMANIARIMVSDERYTSQERAAFMSYAVTELRKEIAGPAKDIKHMVFLASVLDRAAVFNPQYLAEAEAIVKEAIKLSPTKQMLYFELAQIYLAQNKLGEALEVLRATVRLDSSYQQAAVNYLIVALLANSSSAIEEAKLYVDLDSAGEDALRRMGSAYEQSKDFTGALSVYERLVAVNPANPQYHAMLAALLAQNGRIAEAAEEAKKAAALDPQYAKEAEAFINLIKQGR